MGHAAAFSRTAGTTKSQADTVGSMGGQDSLNGGGTVLHARLGYDSCS